MRNTASICASSNTDTPSDVRHAIEIFPRRPFDVVAGERRAHLDFQEDAHEVRPPGAGVPQARELFLDVEGGLLAAGELVDGGRHLHGVEPQRVHDAARRGDFLLRDPAVGLRHVAHDAERGEEELLRRLLRRTVGPAPGPGLSRSPSSTALSN